MSARKSAGSVREPVQVYLSESDRAALDRVAVVTGLPRTEILRRGLRRFAAEVLEEESPALAFLAEANASTLDIADRNVAENHDQFLADSEMRSWTERIPTAKKNRAKK